MCAQIRKGPALVPKRSPVLLKCLLHYVICNDERIARVQILPRVPVMF